MIDALRTAFNEAFTQQRYEAFLNQLASLYNYRPSFRIAETPVFIPDDFRDKLVRACDDIVKTVCHPNFKRNTEGSIEPQHRVPHENAHSTFLVIDFGVCEEQGELVPKLIELQGFPSLFFFPKRFDG